MFPSPRNRNCIDQDNLNATNKQPVETSVVDDILFEQKSTSMHGVSVLDSANEQTDQQKEKYKPLQSSKVWLSAASSRDASVSPDDDHLSSSAGAQCFAYVGVVRLSACIIPSFST